MSSASRACARGGSAMDTFGAPCSTLTCAACSCLQRPREDGDAEQDPQGNAAAAPAAGLRGTARGGSLIPSSFVSFCEDPTHKGGFTPVYEPADGCSYSAHASMSSVNAGAFELYVGGAAINRSFLAPFHSETAAGSASSRPFFLPSSLLPSLRSILELTTTAPALVMTGGLP